MLLTLYQRVTDTHLLNKVPRSQPASFSVSRGGAGDDEGAESDYDISSDMDYYRALKSKTHHYGNTSSESANSIVSITAPFFQRQNMQFINEFMEKEFKLGTRECDRNLVARPESAIIPNQVILYLFTHFIFRLNDFIIQRMISMNSIFFLYYLKVYLRGVKFKHLSFNFLSTIIRL